MLSYFSYISTGTPKLSIKRLGQNVASLASLNFLLLFRIFASQYLKQALFALHFMNIGLFHTIHSLYLIKLKNTYSLILYSLLHLLKLKYSLL
jgi:hypothetical protein